MKTIIRIHLSKVFPFIIIFFLFINYLYSQSSIKYSLNIKPGFGLLYGEVQDTKLNFINSIGIDYNANNNISIGLNFTRGKFEGDEGDKGASRSYSSTQSIYTLKASASVFNVFAGLKKPLGLDIRAGASLGLVSSKVKTGLNGELGSIEESNSGFLGGSHFQLLYDISPKVSLLLEDEFYIVFEDGTDGFAQNNTNDFLVLFSLGLKIKLGKEQHKGKRGSTHSQNHNSKRKKSSQGHSRSKASKTHIPSQTSTTKTVIKKEEPIINKPAKNYDEWEFMLNKEGVKIYIMWLEFEKYVSVKFINSTTTNLDVSFKPYFIKKNGAKTAFNSYLNNVHIEHNTSEIIKIDLGGLSPADVKLDLENLSIVK